MKLFLSFVFVALLLFGCKKNDTQIQPVTTTTKKTESQAREERKVEALESVKKAAEEGVVTKSRVNLAPLHGYLLNDLYTDYLGLKKGVIAPPYVEVSFENQMKLLYNKKVNFSKCKKNGKCKEASDTVLVQMPILFKNYLDNDKKKMSLKTFVGVADNKVMLAKKSLDWNKVCKRYQPKNDTQALNKKKCALIQEVVSRLTGKDMVAYGMTELLPSAEGRLNVAYLDVLLQNAGAEFLYHVPALGDEYASFGFYQFTMYALRRDAEATEGASIINSFVKDGGEKIPDSVVYLKGHEHHVAAFYFAVHNLSRMVFSLSSEGLKNLSKKHESYQDEMVMYVAAAHHAPGTAHKKTVRWINGGMKTSLLGAYRGLRIHPYAVKTKANLIAVYGRK